MDASDDVANTSTQCLKPHGTSKCDHARKKPHRLTGTGLARSLGLRAQAWEVVYDLTDLLFATDRTSSEIGAAFNHSTRSIQSICVSGLLRTCRNLIRPHLHPYQSTNASENLQNQTRTVHKGLNHPTALHQSPNAKFLRRCSSVVCIDFSHRVQALKSCRHLAADLRGQRN